jgi:Protein of unknown function (DUF2726)
VRSLGMHAMDPFDPITAAALLAGVLLLGALALWQRRQRESRRAGRREALDTVLSWPPESGRVMTITERQSYELLRRALPGFMVLAQVPLSRFIRVPTGNPYSEWLHRVGSLSADLLLCDAGSRVLAVIDIRATQETERSRKRHERLARVLKAAGIRVHVWREGDLPSLAEVRTVLGATFGAQTGTDTQPKSTASRPMPLIPVAEIEELLAEGDHHARDAMEPVPSAFFDDMEMAPAGHSRR